MPGKAGPRDATTLFTMLQAAEEALAIVRDTPADDVRTQRALERTIAIVASRVNNVTPEFRDEHPDVPWRDIARQPRWLGDVDPKRVAAAVENRFPQLIRQLAALLPPLPSDPEPEGA